MDPQPRSTSSLWRHYPWLLGVCLAPLLFGSVTIEGQVIVGALLGTSLLLLATRLHGLSDATSPKLWRWLGLLLLVFPLVPLPLGLVELLSPERVRLAREFPVTAGVVPHWLPLTLSPARTLQRLWELSLQVTAFWLAHQAAAEVRFARRLSLALATTVLLIAASDVWFQQHGRQSVLGIWKISWGRGAGTFANRNHFADWICVAVLFGVGGILRTLQPLRSARLESLPRERRHLTDAVWLALAGAAGLTVAVLCGSRGGFVAFLTGLGVWGLLIARRAQSRARWWILGAGAVGLLVLLLGSGDFLFRRLAETRSDFLTRYPKLEVWRQTLALVPSFPLFGTGWGTFATAYSHYKTSGGETTFYHAENDYVQLLLETGVIGVLIFGGLAYRLAHTCLRYAWSRAGRTVEPELFFGALAAVAGFTVHASFEFVFQITATSLLAAVLLGFAVGCCEQAQGPAVPAPPHRRRIVFSLAWAVALLTAAALQGLAFVHWEKGLKAATAATTAIELDQSLSCWPWAANRQIGRARAQLQPLLEASGPEAHRAADGVRRQLTTALAWDPYNWELRLERAWLDLAFSPELPLGLAEAREVARLNPLQPLIPLRFARHLAQRDPDLAWEFLSAGAYSAQTLQAALALGWSLRHDASALWSLTADTRRELLVLGDFAVEHQLLPLADQAYSRLTNRLEAVVLASLFLKTGNTEQAKAHLLRAPDGPVAKVLLARAHWLEKDFPAASRVAELAWLSSRARNIILTPLARATDLDQALTQWKLHPGDVRLAARVAESLFAEPAGRRNVRQLLEFSQMFPGELRFHWLLFRTHQELQHEAEAAEAALRLAEYAVQLEPQPPEYRIPEG